MKSFPFVFVLLPEKKLVDKTILLSQKLSSLRDTRFTLQHASYYPHMTLYMAQLPHTALDKVTAALSTIAENYSALHLEATKYHQDNEGMIEVQYEKKEKLIHLQEKLIESVNPSRNGLREKNPLGYLLTDQLAHATGEEKKNLERYGYDEIGGLFRPHITFTRFKDKEKMFDMSLFPEATTFTGTFSSIALFTLGDNGTCMEKIVAYNLTNN